jgi:hypothetical protein
MGIVVCYLIVKETRNAYEQKFHSPLPTTYSPQPTTPNCPHAPITERPL